ncbi:SUMF1/EgtB/PvdO family nonheme iron enzyme [Termitidicoccus mucosus]
MHVYRFVVNPDQTAAVFRDGELITSEPLEMSGNYIENIKNAYIEFGKGQSSSASNITVDYVSYDDTGAFAPLGYSAQKRDLPNMYSADVLPTQAEPAWTFAGSGDTESSMTTQQNGTIIINSPANTRDRWKLYNTNFDLDTGYTVEIKAQVNSTNGRGLDVSFQTGDSAGHWYQFYISTTAIVYYNSTTGSSNIAENLDNSSAMHVYRFAVDANQTVSVYRDGELITSEPLEMSGTIIEGIKSDYIEFGKGQTARAAVIAVDYVSYDNTGAFAPKQSQGDQNFDIYTNTIGMKFVKINNGSFMMGNSSGDRDEAPLHTVTISHNFYMGITEVTNAQYEEFDPSHENLRGKMGFSSHDDDPVIFVSWQDAVDYCNWLSAKEGIQYRLPTEAEWEYACRAGTTTAYNTGASLPSIYHKNQINSSYPAANDDVASINLRVGNTPANSWGLYDMHGNVEEWCSDWYAPYTEHAVTDPVGASGGDFKVTRGGSHSTTVYYLRSSNRSAALPEISNWITGFRVVMANALVTMPASYDNTQPYQQNVNQSIPSDILNGPDPTKPYFTAPQQYIKLEITENGPFYSHNHQPSITECPNGDLLVNWFTTKTEGGRELSQAVSRLRYGRTEWDPASVFWDVPDRNDTGSALFLYSDQTIYHFSGMGLAGKYGSLALIMRKSEDNGVTWSKSRILNPNFSLQNQVISGAFKLSNESIAILRDASNQGSGGTLLGFLKSDGSFYDPNYGKVIPTYNNGSTGSFIAGIHAGAVQLDDGTLLGLGRGDNIDGQMPKSVSHDNGLTWTYSASGLPSIGSGQRIVLTKLQSGALLLVSFTSGMIVTDINGDTVTVTGMFAALSYDNGETWPHRRLVTDDGPPKEYDGMGNTGKFTMSKTTAEPKGYLAGVQARNGVIHLVSSGVYYSFNEAWIKAPFSTGVDLSPSDLAPPGDQTVFANQSLSLHATVADGFVVSIQWQVSTDGGATWRDIGTDSGDVGIYSGEGTATLAIDCVTAGMNGWRHRYVASTAPGNGVPSTVSILTVNPSYFEGPSAIVADQSGDLYVADRAAHAIRRITGVNKTHLFAGSTAGQPGATDATGTAARFNEPSALAVRSGTLFVADGGNHAIRAISAVAAVTTFAGKTGESGFADGAATIARFNHPGGIAFDSASNAYVADTGNHAIRKIALDGTVSTIAGAIPVFFNSPTGIAVSKNGDHLYVADTGNHAIRAIALPDGAVTTFAGVSGTAGCTEGAPGQTLLDSPSGLLIDGEDTLYVADTGNSRILEITASGSSRTLAGNPGFAGFQDGSTSSAWFDHPGGITMDSSGNLYIADTGNAVIRKIALSGSVSTLILTSTTAPTPPPDPDGNGSGNTGGDAGQHLPERMDFSRGGGGGGGGAPSVWFLFTCVVTTALRFRKKWFLDVVRENGGDGE